MRGSNGLALLVRVALCGTHVHRVDAVLALHRKRCSRTRTGERSDAPVGVAVRGEDGLVGAEEVAETQVQRPDRWARSGPH